ncbi:MAG: hypothetical protein NTX50_27290, partial [Candidatus Sumerlaeota bacterium]|nr:hypothetical protein [Candidatus Sumerlaeota bacterium]
MRALEIIAGISAFLPMRSTNGRQSLALINERQNFAHCSFIQSVGFNFQVIMRLKIHPKLRAHAKVSLKPQSRIGSNTLIFHQSGCSMAFCESDASP